MELFLLLILFLVCAVVYSIVTARKNLARIRERLLKDFGKAPEERTDMESAAALWENVKQKETEATDDITWNDLDMDRVFDRLNGCQTTVGEECLYRYLRIGRQTEPEWEEYLRILNETEEERLACQVLLAQLGKSPSNGLSDFLYAGVRIQTLSLKWLRVLTAMPLIALAAVPLAGAIALIPLMVILLINLLVAMIFKKRIGNQLGAVIYLSRMLWCTKRLSRAGIPGMEPFFDRLNELHKRFDVLRSKMSTVASQAVSASGMDFVNEVSGLFFLGECRAYARGVAILEKHLNEAQALYEMVGQLDVMIAVASFRQSLKCWCVPEFTKDTAIRMQAMTHPLLLEPVPNDACLTRNSIITGSNASGKSTFLKAVAVNALLAQSIGTCVAAAFSLPRAQVISSMALKDDILRGDSYFIAEIKSFKRIMEKAAQGPCLCFVDEILRGTNTIERIAASAAVLSSLGRLCGSLCLVASHDIELTRILAASYDNYHFTETVTDQGVSFDYRLRQGPSNTRNAILLLQTMGFDPQVIHRANELVAAFESTQSWPAFE